MMMRKGYGDTEGEKDDEDRGDDEEEGLWSQGGGK